MDPFYLCFVFTFIILSCLLLAGWEEADLLALLCVMFLCVFVIFPYDVMSQMCYSIVLVPGLCLLYFCIIGSQSYIS